VHHSFTNCWAGHGASDVMAPGKAVQLEEFNIRAGAELDQPAKSELYVEACERACLQHRACEGFIFDSISWETPQCWLKGSINHDECKYDRKYSLYNWIVKTPPDPNNRRNVVRRDEDRIGEWGGSCSCSDGSIYDVGDNGDLCGSLACENGFPGVCIRRAGPWSHNGVVCDKARLQQDEKRVSAVERLNRRFSLGRQSNQLWMAGDTHHICSRSHAQQLSSAQSCHAYGHTACAPSCCHLDVCV
jgi:hypothetical protein